jgi:uncharacterized protein involved in exopolysaccharide biosynthesis
MDSSSANSHKSRNPALAQVGQEGLGDETDFLGMLAMLWESRWLVASITAAFAVGTAIYALLVPAWYTASVLLAPAREKASLGLADQLGNLANLAGIASSATGSVEAVAVLKSRDFARAFIEDQDLLPVLFAGDWDTKAGHWKETRPPDIRRGIEIFDKKVRKVTEDRRTGLVTLSIEWKDPKLAAEWANLLALRLNEHMRQRALTEAETNVKYLRRELETASVVVLQQSTSRLLENEMEKLMLARGNVEFAFRIVDRADVPRIRSKPKRTLMVTVAILLGGMFSLLVVLIREGLRKRRTHTQA